MKTVDIPIMSFQDRIRAIDNGRFNKIISALSISEECSRCHIFDSNAADSCRCACIPSCIGVTLSENVKSYLLWKLERISEEKHRTNLKGEV